MYEGRKLLREQNQGASGSGTVIHLGRTRNFAVARRHGVSLVASEDILFFSGPEEGIKSIRHPESTWTRQ